VSALFPSAAPPPWALTYVDTQVRLSKASSGQAEAEPKLFAIQTGYVESLAGSLVYAVTVSTTIFVQFCLVLLTVSYYNNDNGLGGWTLEKDYQKALLAFEIVW